MTLYIILLESWHPTHNSLSRSFCWPHSTALAQLGKAVKPSLERRKDQLYPPDEDSSRMIPFIWENTAIILRNSIEGKHWKGWSKKRPGDSTENM